MLGTQTWGGKILGADESTELTTYVTQIVSLNERS